MSAMALRAAPKRTSRGFRAVPGTASNEHVRFTTEPHRPAPGPPSWSGRGWPRGVPAAGLPPPALEHDPEKWVPVFGKDHAPSITYSEMAIRRKVISL